MSRPSTSRGWTARLTTRCSEYGPRLRQPVPFRPDAAPGLAVLRVSVMPDIKELEIVANRVIEHGGKSSDPGPVVGNRCPPGREYRPDLTTDE